MSDFLLVSAGIIGISVAIFHGVLMQKLMINPILASSYGRQMRAEVRKLLPLLLHFSSVFWLFAGIALAVAPYLFDQTTRYTVCVFSICFYLYGAIGNCWGTGGRHPGWVLLSVSIILILASIYLA